MRLEPNQFWTYWEWAFDQQGFLYGGILALILAVLGFLVGYIVSTIKHGPAEGFLIVAKIIGQLFTADLPKMSPRRIFAMAKLSFKEAIRSRVLVVVAVFVVAIMFAGWFIDPKSDNPAQLYIPTVLFLTNMLVLLMGLFLSTFSIPRDISSKIIYTMVTKPVRPTEIFLGRVLGMIAVGTVTVSIFAVLSYVFITRGLQHTHEIEVMPTDSAPGQTATYRLHSHTFTLDEQGEGVTDVVKGHRHIVKKVGDKLVVSSQIGDLEARNPIYGKLRFTGRDGEDSEGINVGNISEYLKYVEGDTLASAIFTFNNVPKDLFENSVTFDMTLDAFRTYKGDIVTPVGGIYFFRSIDGAVETERFPFKVKEGAIDQKTIALDIKSVDGKDINFFKDIAPEGNFELVIRCTDRGQYLGMAQGDLYLRAKEKSFEWNFTKGFVSIWLQMCIVICFGVMFSTFLSGPVAIVATLSVIVLGMFGWFLDDLTSGKLPGGGPLEAMIRLPLQSGSVTDLDLGSPVVENTIRAIDKGLLFSVGLLKNALPNLYDLGTTEFVTYGVNLFEGLLARHLTIAFGYFIMTSIISYFFLKTREMAG